MDDSNKDAKPPNQEKENETNRTTKPATGGLQYVCKLYMAQTDGRFLKH
jgi:hypothetical protein